MLNLYIKTNKKVTLTLHTSYPIIKHKANLLILVKELNNVSKSCKVIGVSRDTFHRFQELVEDGGLDALVDHYSYHSNNSSWKPFVFTRGTDDFLQSINITINPFDGLKNL